MRHVHPAMHADARHRPKMGDRRYNNRILSNAGVNSADVAPAALAFFDDRPPALWCLANLFVRKIDARELVVIEGFDHFCDAVDPKFQRQTIIIAVARMCNGVIQFRASVISHAPSELITDLDTASTGEIRLRYSYRSLLQTGNRFRDLPSRARRIAALDRPVIKGP